MGLDWPRSFKPSVSGTGAWSSLGCCFDSTLSTAGVSPGSNATLTITLRLFLMERNAKDLSMVRKSPQTSDLLRDWPGGKFREFKEAVKAKSVAFWDNRFCLVNQLDVSTLDVKQGGKTVRPNIDCRFDIAWADSSASAHQAINCFYPALAKEISKHVNPSNVPGSVGQFTHDLVENMRTALPNAATCTRDVGDPLKPLELKQERFSCPLQFDHLGVAHEIGHLLGLPHVGVARRSHACVQAVLADADNGANARVCYLGNDAKEASNIMGIGSEIADWNAMPWLTRLFQHTGIGPHAWKVSTTSVRPTMI